MRPSINLATEPFVNYRTFFLTAGILGVAALGLSLFLAIQGVRTWRETTTTQGKLRQLETRRGQLMDEQRELENELRTPANLEQLERVRFFNLLIRQKSLSWTHLFFDLQECLPLQVRILSLSPTLQDDGSLSVELRLGAASSTAVIEFLQALEQGKKFRDVVLHSQAQGRGASRDAVDARLSAVYVQE